MATERNEVGLGLPFTKETSVILWGPSATLLNWVAWSFVSRAPGGYHWGDVALPGQAPDPRGPVARGAIPIDFLSVRQPQELRLDNLSANAAISAGILSDEPSTQLRQLSDFLRLPPSTQAIIAARHSDAAPLVIVVSNAHRLQPYYTAEEIRSTLQTFVANHVALFDTYAGAPGDERMLFDNVWHVAEPDPKAWMGAKLEVERAGPFGPLPLGSDPMLRELPWVASTLGRVLDAKV